MPCNLSWIIYLFSIAWFDVGRGELEKYVHPKDSIDASFNQDNGGTSTDFRSSCEGDCERRPAGIPDGKNHDQVLEVVQKLALRRNNNETPLFYHLFLFL